MNIQRILTYMKGEHIKLTLKTGHTIEGRLVLADNSMNLHLSSAKVTDRRQNAHVHDAVLIRGNQVRCIDFDDSCPLDMHLSRLQSSASKSKPNPAVPKKKPSVTHGKKLKR